MTVVGRRVLAVILVLAMLSGFLLYFKTDVSVSAKSVENLGARYATQQLVTGDSYAGSTRLQRMRTYARNLLSSLDNSADCDRAAQIAIAQADFESAINFTEKAIELYHGEEEVDLAGLNNRMGYLFTLLGDYQDALTWLDKGLALKESLEARLTRAQVRLNLGDPKKALTDVEICLASVEDTLPLLPNVVNIYEASGEFETAATCYARLADATGEPEYILHHAYCCTRLGRMTEAAEDCVRYAQAGGTETAAALVMLGSGWMREGSYEEAGSCFGKALDAGYPDPESLYYYIVLCAYVTGNDARVCEYGDKIIEHIRGGAEAGSADVQLENATGRLNVSLVPLDEASLCMMTGASHMRLQEYSEAVECLTHSLELDAENGFAYYLRGSCLLALGRFREATEDFDAALEAGENEEKCRYGRAVCRSQLGDIEGALEDFDWVMLHGTDDNLFLESSSFMMELMNNSSETGEEEQASPAP